MSEDVDRNEIDIISFLGNGTVRNQCRGVCEEIEPASELGKDLLEFYVNLPISYSPDDAVLRVFLKDKNYSEGEINLAEVKLLRYKNVKLEGCEILIKSFNKYYTKTKVMQATNNFNEMRADDPDKAEEEFLKAITEIKRTSNRVFEMVDLSQEDVDKVIEEEIGSEGMKMPTKFQFVKRSMSYKAYVKGHIIQWCAPPGVGKTIIMLQECIEMAKKGYKILWVALGDMMRSDFFIRVTAIITRTPINDVTENVKKHMTPEVNKVLSMFRFNIQPADEYSASELVDGVLSISKEEFDFQVFVLDYDDNLSQSVDNMYLDGAKTYKELSKIARLKGNFKLVFVASQVKQEMWGLEPLPENCCSQSSKKQAIIDMQITMNCNSENKQIGTLNVPKQRRGVKLSVHYRIGNDGVVSEIPKSEYQTLAAQKS